MANEQDFLRSMIKGGELADRAKARADRIDRHLLRNQSRLTSLEERVRVMPDIRRRILWVRQAAEVLAEAARDNVRCHSGCTGCCPMPTMLTLEEAKLIARETAAPLTVPATYAAQPEAHFTGKPCTCLQDGHCNIYNSRPMACRVHYVVADDPTLCQIDKDATVHAPHYNADAFQLLYAQANNKKKGGSVDDIRLADIRTFSQVAEVCKLANLPPFVGRCSAQLMAPIHCYHNDLERSQTGGGRIVRQGSLH